ncbi:MAG: hypothetical protein DWI57_10330 [Chloroflexi bacterium]|nr:MAG: hypothetical protein DWI57_10330 [Chloroflexota bacterium]
MTTQRKIYATIGLPLLLLVSLFWVAQRGLMAPAAPPAIVQGQSFSIAAGSALALTGIHPADILGAGGLPLIACQSLGLVCDDPETGAQDDLTALSYGWDFQADGFAQMQFSVSAASRGLLNTAVRAESGCSPAEPDGDFFRSPLDETNSQDLDGDGNACAGNSGYGLGLGEGATLDGVDAGDRDPCQFVDIECDGIPDAPIYFALAAGSPTLALVEATPADVLVTGFQFVPSVYASAASLGLVSGDAIAALCLYENGDGVFGSDDQMLFSLGKGSPSLVGLNGDAASILAPGPLRLVYRADKLGLLPSDEVDALLCSTASDVQRLYLPEIQR